MFTQHSSFGPAADKFGPIGGGDMAVAWGAIDEAREQESVVFVEPAVNAEIYLDGLAFASYREGHFHIATYVKQAGPNGIEHIVNLRTAMPASAVLDAIPVLLSMLPAGDFMSRAAPVLIGLLKPLGMLMS
jgi:hypothetical protein